MTRITLRAIGLTAILSVLVLSLNLIVGAQSDKSKTPAPDSKATGHQHDMNKSANTQSDMFSARLVDAEKKAQNKEATVEVMVKGVKLVDPATTDGKARKDQGHLHYQVDGGPVIATPAAKLSFHGLSSGEHKIVVMLANNDHSPAGSEQTLMITVP